MSRVTYAQAVSDALREELRRNEKVFLIGEDMGVYGGCFGITRGFLEEFGPERIIDAPISEGGFTGMAVGAATGRILSGRRVHVFGFFDLRDGFDLQSGGKAAFYAGRAGLRSRL